jgi:hypothetical protein
MTEKYLSCVQLTGPIEIATCFFFYYLVGWDFGYCGHYWPIVPASGDNEDDCGEADGM